MCLRRTLSWGGVHSGSLVSSSGLFFFFFNATAITEIYTLSLHDALPIWIGHVGQNIGCVRADRADDRLGVGVEQQLRRVEAKSVFRLVGAVDAVAVALSRTNARQIDVPVVRGLVLDRDPGLVVILVEQAQLDALGALGEQREVRALAVPARAERKRLSTPDERHLTSAPASGGSSTSVRSS